MPDGAPSRPILRYHGGKWRLAPWIIAHFPQHRVYVEAFGGAGYFQRVPAVPQIEKQRAKEVSDDRR